MSAKNNLEIAQGFLSKIAAGASGEDVASLFSNDLDWNIPGSSGALPWVGRKSGKQAVVDFVNESPKLIERLRFNIQDVLAGDRRAVILGDLATRVNNTGKVIESAFAIVLTVDHGLITHFLMLEDSFCVAQATSVN